MTRSRSVVAALVMVLVGLAPVAGAQLVNEPPDYFVDMSFERKVWNETVDVFGNPFAVAGPPVYVPGGAGDWLATWEGQNDPAKQDEFHFFLTDPLSPIGFERVRSIQVPQAWNAHDFHRQWMEANDDYLVIAGWSPTLGSANHVLVYKHDTAGGVHNFYRVFDFSEPAASGALPATASSYASTGNVPTDDLDLFDGHVAWAGGGVVRVFWDYCKELEENYWDPTVDPNVNQVTMAIPPPAGPIPWNTGDRTTYSTGQCWAEEKFGLTHELFNPTYAVDGNVAVRFWQNGGNLYLVVLDPMFNNGPDPNNALKDFPKGRFQLFQHDPAMHQWVRVPIPAQYENGYLPHDSGCPRGGGFGQCYHYTADRVSGAGIATMGPYLMVTETREHPLTDFQMAHFYHFNSTGAFVHHSFTNITMLFQGTFGHALWSDAQGNGGSTLGSVLMHVKDFHQEPFKKKPFFLETFHRKGSLHELRFAITETPTPQSQFVNPLESSMTKHFTTCSEVDLVRRPGNLFYTTRMPSKWLSFAYEDNVTREATNGDVVETYQVRDNWDPSVPHPYLNDVQKMYEFPFSGGNACDRFLCEDQNECARPIEDPADPDNRDRFTYEAPPQEPDDRDPSTFNEDEQDRDAGSGGDEEDTSRDEEERPRSRFPIDRDGDGVPENEIEGFELDNCPGEYNPIGDDGVQPPCRNEDDDNLGGGGQSPRDEEPVTSSLRPASKLPGEAWVTLAIGLALVLLVFLVARRRQDEDEA